MDETNQLLKDLKEPKPFPIGRVRESPLVLPNYSGIRGRHNPIITVGTVAPTSPQTGDIWVDTS